MLSPFLTSAFKKDVAAGWFNPLDIIYTKTTSPDIQKHKTANDAYINAEDKAYTPIK
jgi:hypothetical protein